MTKNADPHNYSNSSCRIGFDIRGTFSLSDGSGCGKNVIKFGINDSFSLKEIKIEKR